MGLKTSIEWTDTTWSPTRGCSRVSEGCRNCYAERMAARFGSPHYVLLCHGCHVKLDNNQMLGD